MLRGLKFVQTRRIKNLNFSYQKHQGKVSRDDFKCYEEIFD
ncbi:hypothetical protein [Campylobacter concisus]|nr:hypothetical protein [Campylobacter concisus]